MVNGQDSERSRIARKSNKDSSRFRKNKFDGTKLPLVVLNSQNHNPMYGRSLSSLIRGETRGAPIRKTAPSDKGASAVGDKIELTVTIVAREHYDHGRKRY